MFLLVSEGDRKRVNHSSCLSRIVLTKEVQILKGNENMIDLTGKIMLDAVLLLEVDLLTIVMIDEIAIIIIAEMRLLILFFERWLRLGIRFLALLLLDYEFLHLFLLGIRLLTLI
jgi:hypothetical protein